MYRYSQFRRLFPNDRLSSLKVSDDAPTPPKPSPCVGCEKEVATLKTHLKTSQTANTQLKTESAQKDEMMKTQADKFAKKEVKIHADYKQEMQDMRAKAGFTIASIDKERSELKQQLEPQRRLVRRL